MLGLPKRCYSFVFNYHFTLNPHFGFSGQYIFLPLENFIMRVSSVKLNFNGHEQYRHTNRKDSALEIILRGFSSIRINTLCI